MAKTGKQLRKLKELLKAQAQQKQGDLQSLKDQAGETGLLLKEQGEETARMLKAQNEELTRTLKGLTQTAGRHDMAIADMLDTWEEWREEQRRQTESLRNSLDQESRQATREMAERQDALKDALVAAVDQLFLLGSAAKNAGQDAWARQLQLAEAEVRAQALKAGLQVIGEPGEVFSYDLHEATEQIHTDQADRHMTIARVFSQGYWLNGRLLRKAKVSVYTN